MRSFGWLTASVVAVFAVLGVAAPAQAAPAYPKANGRCVDQTGVLGQDLCAAVTGVLLRDEEATSDEIAVAVVPTTGDASIEKWSTGLFNTWGVGKKRTNNGVLLVVALDDHKVRLETGRGVRSQLGDSDAAEIVDDVTSHFADDEYALGILTGLDDVRRQLGHSVAPRARLVSLATLAPEPTEPEVTDADDPDLSADGSEFTSPDDFASVGEDDDAPVVPIVIGGFVVVALLSVAIGRGLSGSASGGTSSFARTGSTRRTSWTGSSDSSSTSSASSFDSSGSSSGGFGGGSSDGGGGASGSW